MASNRAPAIWQPENHQSPVIFHALRLALMTAITLLATSQAHAHGGIGTFTRIDLGIAQTRRLSSILKRSLPYKAAVLLLLRPGL
jgi:hypothetical protein